jgi:hypothetical protein
VLKVCTTAAFFAHVFKCICSDILVGLPGVRDSFGVISEIVSCRGSSNLALDLLACADEVNAEGKKDESSQDAPNDPIDERIMRRRMVSFAKRKRMSLWASTTQIEEHIVPKQKPLFRSRMTLCRLDESVRQSLSESVTFQNDDISSVVCEIGTDDFDPMDVLKNEDILPLVFAYLMERDVTSNASGVCTAWADAATTATVNLLLSSVGTCDDAEDNDVDDKLQKMSSVSSGRSQLERSWSYLNSKFPWGCFLSDGACKRVYKVHNAVVGRDEALSVMYVALLVSVLTTICRF